MILITRQLLANQVAERWKSQYENANYKNDWDVIYCKLLSLGKNPKPDDVDSIIGNGSWTSTKCDECGSKGVDIVEIGEEPDYDSATACVCKSCLAKAMGLMT